MRYDKNIYEVFVSSIAKRLDNLIIGKKDEMVDMKD